MGECVTCTHEAEIRELQKDAERNSKQHKEFYSEISIIKQGMAVSDERYSNILSMMNEVKTGVFDLKEKPSKRYDSIITHSITAIISSVIGIILSLAFTM